MIIARYDVIRDQSERANLYNHLRNYTKLSYSRPGLCSQNDRYEQQKKALEAKVKALENELERARNRLKSLRAQAEERVGVYSKFLD